MTRPIFPKFMKLTVEINNLSKEKIRKDFFERIARKTLELSELDLQKKNISFSVALVPKEEIKELNRIYRKKDAVTDVLSFAEYKNAAEIKEEKERNVFLGELVLCYNDIKEFALKNKIDTKNELANVVSHGILHLLGMKHGKNMFAIQEKVKNE